METYVPYPDLAATVAVFDSNMISLQAVSIVKLLNILHEVETVEEPQNYNSHPEVIKWKGHEPWLCELGFMLAERITFDPFKIKDAMSWHLECATSGEFTMEHPEWWGVSDYHIADQAALLRLDFPHYSNHFEGVALDIPPYWTRHLTHG